jgi:signal transduction histidine kinase
MVGIVALVLVVQDVPLAFHLERVERDRLVALPVRSGDSVLGAIRLAYPASEIDHRAVARLRTLLVAVLVSLAAALVVAVAVAAPIARPLRRLRTATDSLAAGDLATRAATDSGPPEVRALATSFDTMAGRIEQMVVAQRAFAGDASHQLRTPLTALRLRIEQAAALVEEDPAAARRRLEAAAGEIDRLARLTDGLLTLARADAEASVVTVDLAATARDRAAEWRPLADENGVSLVVEAPATASVLAVAGAAEQIIDNYVDNALDVAPAGSTLQIRVEPDRTGVALHVVDEGPGLGDDQRTRAFDRFWQAGSGHGGTGLGLAVIHRLASASGARVELRQAPAGGIDAVATFRAAPEAPGTPPAPRTVARSVAEPAE